jgi:hypothetical protein
MPTFEVASVRERGQQMILVPMSSRFGYEPENNQHAMISEIQAAALGAGLSGEVVLVWPTPSGRTQFISPPQWQAMFNRLSYRWVRSKINGTLSW